MANETHVPSRHVQKHDIEANWIKAGKSENPFIPLNGEIIIYSIEVDAEGNTLELPEGRAYPITYTRQKIGDGIHNVNELPFVGVIKGFNSLDGGSIAELEANDNFNIIDAGNILL